MKTGAKIVCIIALVIGLIWATIGFFGAGIGGALSSSFQDSETSSATIQSTANVMIKLIGSFVVVIIGGVLGIVGSDKKPAKTKTIILGSITLVCGIVLFPLHNYIAAVLLIVAGLLLLIAGMITKQEAEAAK